MKIQYLTEGKFGSFKPTLSPQKNDDLIESPDSSVKTRCISDAAEYALINNLLSEFQNETFLKQLNDIICSFFTDVDKFAKSLNTESYTVTPISYFAYYISEEHFVSLNKPSSMLFIDRIINYFLPLFNNNIKTLNIFLLICPITQLIFVQNIAKVNYELLSGDRMCNIYKQIEKKGYKLQSAFNKFVNDIKNLLLSNKNLMYTVELIPDVNIKIATYYNINYVYEIAPRYNEILAQYLSEDESSNGVISIYHNCINYSEDLNFSTIKNIFNKADHDRLIRYIRMYNSISNHLIEDTFVSSTAYSACLCACNIVKTCTITDIDDAKNFLRYLTQNSKVSIAQNISAKYAIPDDVKGAYKYLNTSCTVSNVQRKLIQIYPDMLKNLFAPDLGPEVLKKPKDYFTLFNMMLPVTQENVDNISEILSTYSKCLNYVKPALKNTYINFLIFDNKSFNLFYKNYKNIDNLCKSHKFTLFNEVINDNIQVLQNAITEAPNTEYTNLPDEISRNNILNKLISVIYKAHKRLNTNNYNSNTIFGIRCIKIGSLLPKENIRAMFTGILPKTAKKDIYMVDYKNLNTFYNVSKYIADILLSKYALLEDTYNTTAKQDVLYKIIADTIADRFRCIAEKYADISKYPGLVDLTNKNSLLITKSTAESTTQCFNITAPVSGFIKKCVKSECDSYSKDLNAEYEKITTGIDIDNKCFYISCYLSDIILPCVKGKLLKRKDNETRIRDYVIEEGKYFKIQIPL